MELVNRNFVKMDKVDLSYIKSNQSIESVAVNNLLILIDYYEKLNDSYIGEFYLNTSGLYYNDIKRVCDFMVSRRVLLNAFIYAGYNHDLEILFKLKPFLSKSQISLKELGNLSDYVMDHSIDFDEFCDGQELKLIFDESDNSFKNGFIFDVDNEKIK